MVPAVSDRIPRVPPYSGYHLKIILYVYRAVTSFGPAFQPVPLRTSFRLMVLQPRHCLNNTGLGSSHFARRYFGNRCFFLFLRLLRCFSSPGSLDHTMDSCERDTITRAGFPHSDIHGSKLAYNSPWLFAVNRVLLRLLVPRHSPCALISLISSSLLDSLESA